MDEEQFINSNKSHLNKIRSSAITSDSGNSSNSPTGSPILETSFNSQIIPEDVHHSSTIVFEKTALEKSRSFIKSTKKRSTKSLKIVQQTASSSSSSVEFDFGGQSVIVQKLTSVSIDEGIIQSSTEIEDDDVFSKENIIVHKTQSSADSEGLQTAELGLDKISINEVNKLLLEVKSPPVKSFDAISMNQSSHKAPIQKKEPKSVLEPEISQKVIVQGKLPQLMKKYKTTWMIGDPSESSRLIVSSKNTTEESPIKFENVTVGTIKGVKRYNTFAALVATNDEKVQIPAVAGTSSNQNDQLLSDTDNSKILINDQATANTSTFHDLKSKVKAKISRKSLTEEEKLLLASDNIKQDEKDRSLKCKFVIGSLLAVLTIFLWTFAVYYTMPYSSSSDNNYNFTKNDHQYKVASTPMDLPIKRIFLVIDDCRASDRECNEASNSSVSVAK